MLVKLYRMHAGTPLSFCHAELRLPSLNKVTWVNNSGCWQCTQIWIVFCATATREHATKLTKLYKNVVVSTFLSIIDLRILPRGLCNCLLAERLCHSARLHKVCNYILANGEMEKREETDDEQNKTKKKEKEKNETK